MPTRRPKSAQTKEASSPSRQSRARPSAQSPARNPSDAVDENVVRLRLTPQQVGKVVREARGEETASLSMLLTVLSSREDIPPIPFWEKRYRGENKGQFSLSLVKGLLMLTHMLSGEPVGLKELADGIQMGSSTTFRYLHTLRIIGLVEQDPKTHKYRLAL